MGLLEERFGTLAVKNGFLTIEQLKEGLNRQVEENIAGEPHRVIGAILMDLDYLDENQIAKILLSLQNE